MPIKRQLMQTTRPVNVDEYIESFPLATQVLLKQLRDVFKRAAPKAEESISYGLAAYKHHGPLVYFGGFKAHIGFYPTGTSLAQFENELAPYKRSKGTVQFPLNEPLPLKLIEKIVKYRVEENEAKAAAKKK